MGGGLAGFSIAYGLARLGLGCVLLDSSDTDFRAARGNFGLVWVQGKGAGFSAYADWTMRSSELWPTLCDELQDMTGHDLGLEQDGGIHICLSQQEYDDRKDKLDLLRSHQNGRFIYEMLDRRALLELQPDLGPDVVGGSWCPSDGHVNPLYLLRSLHDGFLRRGGHVHSDAEVDDISHEKGIFTVKSRQGLFRAPRLVLAAGLGNRKLAPLVGLRQPVRPQKGQILVTQKTDRLIRIPMTLLRQTAEGSIMIGDSKEEVGFDISSSTDVMAQIAHRAERTIPALKHQQIIRSWGALRVMSPDGYPVYDQSPTHPGAYAVTCHSGVTLAAAHAMDLAGDIAAGGLAHNLHEFTERRFDVSPD
ncbi:MAG: FAD-dependent oxidoreductase [Pseudomonadota bacterium]|nr:FAD-dependent oxidoreductase [Pseudomonadota bacterium]